MKTAKYILFAAIGLLVASCSEDYLTQEPGGSQITENQFQRMDNAVEGMVRGIYTYLYAYGGDHDAFGQRSLDIYGDLLCGDMAMKTFNYGWFSSDELAQTYTRTATFWMYYYEIIRACNKAINALDNQGHPSLTFDKITDEQYRNGYFYAEVLAMRGWAYAGLSRYYVPVGAPEDYTSVPIYTEDDTKNDTTIGHPRATVYDLYARIESDLTQSIKYFEAYNKWERESKIELNVDAARILLAYSYLNKGNYEKALEWATKAITEGQPNILPYAEVLTTGFNNVEHNNWIWGEDVTVANSTGLASFFGQCDIYSYSYASAGDIKGIDENLYNSIPNWDIRKGWWNNYAQSGNKNADRYEYAPDGKFYSATSKKLQGDRDWLSDNVYMRWELAYLIAAEAAARSTGKITESQNYLFAITDQRAIPDSATLYNTWKASLTDQASLLAAIKQNWRVELWGEGYGLQTFRRYGETVTLGSNHKRSDKNQTPNTARKFTFELPNVEVYYNPSIRNANNADTQELKKKD